MKITEGTPQRLVITARRKLLPDIAFVFFLGMGSLLAAAMAQEDMRDAVNTLALFLGLLFAGVGVWGLLKNASDHAVLDAPTQTLTITRRRLLGTRTVTVPFRDLVDVSVHEDDDMRTVAFSVKDRDEDILLETTFTANRQAGLLAAQIRQWLETCARSRGR